MQKLPRKNIDVLDIQAEREGLAISRLNTLRPSMPVGKKTAKQRSIQNAAIMESLPTPQRKWL